MARDFLDEITIQGQRVLRGLLIAGALSDAVGNPTGVDSAATYGLVWDGTNWVRARTLEPYKTASATPDVGIHAVGLAERRFSAVSLATAANSTQTWDAQAASSAVLACGTTTTGTFIIEVTADGTNWYSAEVVEATTDRVYTAINITPTANTVFRVYTAGIRTVRVRTVTTLGATVSFTANLSGFPSRYVAQDAGQGRNLAFAAISGATSGNNTLVAAAGAGLKIKVVSYVVVADGTVTLTFQSGAAGTALSGAMALVANSGVSAISQPSSHLMETAANTLLNMSLSAAIGVRGHLSYYVEP